MQETANTTNPAASDTLRQLQEEVARMLNQSTVDLDVGLAELGIDSLSVVELIMACERIYQGVPNPERLQIDQFTTLRQLDRQLLGASASSDEGAAEHADT